MNIRLYNPSDRPAWDTYVNNHPHATLYHLSGWKNVIEKTYGHKTYYLMAVEKASFLRHRRIAISQFHPGTEKKSVKSRKSCLNLIFKM